METGWLEHIKGSGGGHSAPWVPKVDSAANSPQSPIIIIIIIINIAVGVRRY